jgi:hypothetical protein
MWLYLGSSCLDRPSSEELSTAEVDSRIHKVLDLGVNPNPGASHAPLHEGVTSARVSKLSPILALHRVLGVAVVSHEMSTRSRMWQGGRRRMPPKRKCRLKEREKESRRAVGRVAMGRGVDTPLDLGLLVREKR